MDKAFQNSFNREVRQELHELTVMVRLLKQEIKELKEERNKEEPVAWMYPMDLIDFETQETSATAYSIAMVSPTKGETIPLYRRKF